MSLLQEPASLSKTGSPCRLGCMGASPCPILITAPFRPKSLAFVATGSDRVLAAALAICKNTLGMPVGGVYVSPDFETAVWYPQGLDFHNTGPISKNKHGLPGGELICLDGTAHLKVVFRYVEDSHHQVWHREAENGAKQSLC